MSEKPKANGHDKSAESPIENPATVRSRRYRERKARGAVVLRDVELAADLLEALARLGWLHPSEKNNLQAITAAVGGIVYQALSAGVKPAQPGKALVPVSLEAIRDAICWLRPDEREQVTPETAGKAVGVVARCSALAGFSPEVYVARLKQTMAEIKARGVVKLQSMPH